MKTVMAIVAVAVVVVNLHRVGVAPVLAQDRVPTLITQVRTALGGEQRLADVRAINAEGPSRRAIGARSVDSYVALLVVRPDKIRRSEESRFLGSTTERISTFNGTQAWDETVAGVSALGGHGGFDHGAGGHGSGGVGASGDHGGWDHSGEFEADQVESSGAGGALTAEQIDAARIRRMKMQLQRWTIALLAESKQPFTDAGRAESPDGPADVLETTDEAGRAVRYFIDPTSHMPLMVQYTEMRAQAPPTAVSAGAPNNGDASRRRADIRAAGPPRAVTVAMHLADYKKVDGVMWPHQIDVSIDGQASEAWTIETFKVNPKVRADTFQKPAK